MEQLRTILVQEYDIVPTSILSVRSVWKVETEKGTFAAKVCDNSTQQLHYIHQSLQYLRQSGFTAVSPYVLTKAGQPFVQLEDGALYLVPWIEGRTGRDLIERSEWIASAFSQLGTMHRMSIGKYKEQIETLQTEGNRLQQNWNQRIHRMNEFRELVNKRIYPSPIDVVFMANIDELMEMAIEATGRLEEWLKSSEESNEIRLTLCHGRLNPEHMIQSDELYFINFDRANLDFPARDLSYMIRYLTARMGEAAIVEDWLNRYVAENPLGAKEIEILNISLQYPSMLIQFLERYYSEQFAGKWTEISLVRRFEKMIDEQQLLLHI